MQRESGDTGPVAEAARADRDPDRAVAQNETEPDDGAAQANADREAERADKEAQIEDAWRRLDRAPYPERDIARDWAQTKSS